MGATAALAADATRRTVSTHAPVMGATMASLYFDMPSKFQPTRP